MSFSRPSGHPLLDPLAGKTATFLIEGRQANVKFARELARSVAGARTPGFVFDLDALYSSNADAIFGGLEGKFTVKVPAPGSDIEAEFSTLFEAPLGVIVVDTLNTFYHLISMGDGRSRGRKLMFALESLSKLARENNIAVVLSMYRREGFGYTGKTRSISNLSDVTASVYITGDVFRVTTERGSAWTDGYSSRIL